MAGGIGDYGSDESEDDDARSARGSDSSETDEEELHHRIRAKQDAFRRKEQELQEKLAQEALIARGESQVSFFLFKHLKGIEFFFLLSHIKTRRKSFQSVKLYT